MKIPKALLKKLAQLSDSKLRQEDSVEMSEFEPSDGDLSQQVLLSEDLLSKVFEQLSLLKPSGFTDAEIARYGLVCRTWRQASRQLPIVVELKRPLQPDQVKALLTNDQQIRALTFAEGDAAALDILQDPSFCKRQGKSMISLWKIDDVDRLGSSINLLEYPNLQKLFFNCEPRLGSREYRGPPARLVTFDSRLISHLHKLQVLSLRGYHTVDLLSLPLSLQMLYVGRAGLTIRASHHLDQEDADFAMSESQGTQQNSAFPKGLFLQQVVVNSQRGGWLGKPLSLYLAVAKQVTFYGRTLLVRSPYEEACTELAQQLADSPTEQLDLEFDVISIIRVAPGIVFGEENEEYRWHRQECAVSDLAKTLRGCLLPHDRHQLHYSRGRLFQHSITIVKIPKHRLQYPPALHFD